METSQIAVIGIIAFVLLVFVIWFFSTWNRFVNLEENADQAWANIDVILNQRYDMIPNLVNMVKGYAAHEKEIFEQFANARNQAAAALSAKNVGGVAAAEGMLAGMMPRINALSEAYPDLKANQNFLNLQQQLLSLENNLADRREAYNATSTMFNKAIKQIPANFVASMKGCTERDLWVVAAHMRENVIVTF